MSRETESSAQRLLICWDDTRVDTFPNILSYNNNATLEQGILNYKQRKYWLVTGFIYYAHEGKRISCFRKKKRFNDECFVKL